MSTHQQSKLRSANQSITEASSRPGTLRSKVGCDAMDEPCTNSTVPAVAWCEALYFSHRNRRTSPFLVQCCCPVIARFTLMLQLPSFAHADAAADGIRRVRTRAPPTRLAIQMADAMMTTLMMASAATGSDRPVS